MMSNAGRTRSFGAELAAVWRVGDFRFTGNYGYTNAKFLAYRDGDEDYSGNYVPYAPRNTLSVQCDYILDFRGNSAGRLVFGLGGQGAGRILWNETGTISQPFYGLLNASVAWETAHNFTVSIWGRNLTGTRYNTFYFKSVGNSFVQRGKPVQAGINIFVNF
jgi:outer membrane receptor protein involved in Fe transport